MLAKKQPTTNITSVSVSLFLLRYPALRVTVSVTGPPLGRPILGGHSIMNRATIEESVNKMTRARATPERPNGDRPDSHPRVNRLGYAARRNGAL